MKLNKTTADIFVPDGMEITEALKRTTHLAIGAHQDDLEIKDYHGIAECYNSETKWFTGIVVTNGAGSARSGRYADYTDDEMQQVRREEQRKAASIGQYAAQFQLNFPSSEVKDISNHDVVDDLFSILEIAKPEVVYVHNLADKHETHVATALRTIKAIRMLPLAERPETVYGTEVWRDLDWLSDDDKIALPVNKNPELAMELVEVFESQIAGGKRYDLATKGRRLANATYHSSHTVDECNALIFAMDLTPLIKDDTIDIKNFIAEKIENFKSDVENKITNLI
jgi:LmbE family N-acetylglucosaminyl deacetylase